MTRVGIFFFYDSEGKADRYIDKLLKAASTGLKRLIIVSNGQITPDTEALFQKYSSPNDIIVRENEGLDVWAYKTGIDYLTWDTIHSFDELVLFNCTIFPSVHSFDSMFSEMEKRSDLDFWGINVHYGTPSTDMGGNSYGYLPKHLQSHFLVFRKSVTSAENFMTFWDEMFTISGYRDSVGRFESFITKWLEDQGYRWSAFIDSDNLQSLTPYPLFDLPDYCIDKLNSPVFKRMDFIKGSDHFVGGRNDPLTPKNLLNYLKSTFGYDESLVFENIIRTGNQRFICENLGMIYTIKENDDISKSDNNFVLIIEAENPKSLDSNTISLLSEMYDTFIVSPSTMEDPHIDNVHYCAKGEENAKNLFTGASCDISSYSYACVITAPVKTANIDNIDLSRVVEMEKHFKWEDSIRILKMGPRSVESIFDSNRYLGLLTPQPDSYDLIYDYNEVISWQNSFEFMRDFLSLSPATVNRDTLPITSHFGIFWLKVSTISNSFQIMDEFYSKIHSKQELSFFLSLLIQKNGFLPAFACDEHHLIGRNIEFENRLKYIKQLYLEGKVSILEQEKTFSEDISDLEEKLKIQNSIKHLVFIKTKNWLKKCLPNSIYRFFMRAYHVIKK